MSDELWAHFVPLWTDSRKVSPSLLLAGGYGLFLKQKRTIEGSLQTLIAMDRWGDQNPRVTKDFDLIAEVNLIASREQQTALNTVLGKHEFFPVPGNERWQFEKKLDGDRKVRVDYHTPEPTEERSDLYVDDYRIKPKPSLHGVGIHGRTNGEAVGCEVAPFLFVLEGNEIAVPNPVTWTVMKLIAMRDQWEAAQDLSKETAKREFFNAQANKHAQDVFRVVAMMTVEESDRIGSVLDVVRPNPVFSEAGKVLNNFFGDGGSFGLAAIKRFWRPEDAAVIREILPEWFR